MTTPNSPTELDTAPKTVINQGAAMYHSQVHRSGNGCLSWTVMCLMSATSILVYLVAVSGVLFDIIRRPASIGEETDATTGAVSYSAFKRYNSSTQYVTEGLGAGAIVGLATLGFLLLHRSSSMPGHCAHVVALAGLALAAAGWYGFLIFLRLKNPSYLG